MSILIIALLSFPLPGCAIHYFDPETGTEHLWGIGHMRMKSIAPTEDVRAVVHGTETLGVAFGHLRQEGYLHLGAQRRQVLEVLDADTSVRFEWPDSDFFNVRVGSELPGEFVQDAKEKTESAEAG